jgi:hypothetical protein
MKTCFGVAAVVVCLFVTPFQARSQSCDTAMALPNGHVLIRWCCPAIPTINLFGTSVQRRNELDPNFWEIPQSTCICPASAPCSIVDTTVSSGVWYYRIREIDLDGTVAFRQPMRVEIANLTSVQEAMPMQFSLGQNYPNPFNPTTVIPFTLSQPSRATLKVFSILGEQIAILIDEQLAGGSHTFTWDGSSVSGGVYYYRLQSNGRTETKKLILLK